MNDIEIPDKVLDAMVSKFEDKLTKEQSLTLDQWLDESDDHRQLVEKLESLWIRSADLSYFLQARKTEDWKVVQARISHPTIAKQAFGIAASIVLVAMISVVVWWYVSAPTRYYAEAGKIEVTLPDHTIVTLNQGSRLTVPRNFGGTERTVELSGEGYFKVARDETLPFTVYLENTATQVLGTAFNLFASKDFVEVMVTEGLVAFGGKTTTQLAAGEAARYIDREGRVERIPFEEVYLSWISGSLNFNETPLTIAIEAIERHFSVEIAMDKVLQEANYTLTGEFEEEDVSEVLEQIALLLNLKVEQAGGAFFLTQPSN